MNTPKMKLYKPKETNTMKTNQPTETPAFNWNALRTKVLITIIALSAGLIGGYVLNENIRQDARASVVQDMQLVKATSKQ